tara:strand:+ start:2052 stop:4376 length:2325 start_codon:yes stop_codon:yes gene_type:complete
MRTLKELPEIKDQWRPRYVPDSIIRTSIQHQHARGIDTETLDGKCYLLSYEHGKEHRKSKTWELFPTAHYTNSFADIVDAMLKGGRMWYRKKGEVGYTHPIYFFWNLKFDAQAFLKHLPAHIIDRVYLDKKVSINYRKEEIVDGECEETDHTDTVEIFYLPKKCLRFSFHKKHEYQPEGSDYKVFGGRIEFFDIMQFYGGSLNHNAKKYLGDIKTESCFDGSKLDVSKLGDYVMVKKKMAHSFVYDKVLYHEYYKDDIEYYCNKDAVLCGRLARKKLRDFVLENVQFKNPYSIASIAQTDLMFKGYMQKIPDEEEHEIPLRIALTAYHGGWFEACTVGRIDDAMYVDLKSAYLYSQYHLPAMTKQIPVMTKDGKRQRIKKGEPLFDTVLRGSFVMQSDEADNNPQRIHEELIAVAEPRTDHSPIYVHVDAEFKKNRWNPLCYVGEYGVPLTTPREFTGWITYDEYKEALKWPHHYILANAFSAWIDDEDESDYPFRPFIDYWFDVKESKDPSDPAYTIAKQLAVSPYGKTIQDIEGRSGTLYHPHYASMTTGICRASIARFIRKNDYKVEMVATDGVLIRKKDLKCIPKRYLDAKSNLGEWEIEDEDVDAIVLMSGVYGFKHRTKKVKKAYFDDVDGRIQMVETSEPYTKSKARGSAQYFINRYKSWFDFVDMFGDEESVDIDINRPYSLGEARRLVEARVDGEYEKVAQFNLMNIFETHTFTMKARGDSRKRMYDVKHQPTTFKDLMENTYDLLPYDSWHQVDYVLSGGKSGK